MRLYEVLTVQGIRVGIVPYLPDGRCLFMEAEHGDIAIATGGVRGRELPKTAAIRIGVERLGLRRTNAVTEPFLAWSGMLMGSTARYRLKVHAVLVQDPKWFAPDTIWLNRKEFKLKGRETQQPIALKVFDKVEKHLRTQKA